MIGTDTIEADILWQNRLQDQDVEHGHQSDALGTNLVQANSEDVTTGLIRHWLEVWDYVGGAQFRGFTAERLEDGEMAMFVFFDSHVIGKDLKQAYVHLLVSVFLGSVQNLVLTEVQAYGIDGIGGYCQLSMFETHPLCRSGYSHIRSEQSRERSWMGWV